jgi:glycosyltransferase involved in cell wall biosynthesis
MGALSYAAQIGRYLAKHRQKIDLVYSRCPYSTLMACGVGLPFIYEAHALPRTVFHRSLEAIILKSRWLQSFVVISRALKKDYMSIFPWLSERPMVAHDGASVTDNRIEEEVSQNDHQFKVIYTGSLLPGKGVELVVDLSWRLSQYDFHIIGGPSEVWRNKYRSEDTLKNLHYHGFLSPSLVRQWQEKADILLLPNQSQVFTDAGRVDIGRWTSPLKLFEYMASHTPIVASDLPVIREVLTHGENALLAKPEFPESWVQAINHLNKDRQLAARIADCAYQDLIQNYTWKQRANKVLL